MTFKDFEQPYNYFRLLSARRLSERETEYELYDYLIDTVIKVGTDKYNLIKSDENVRILENKILDLTWNERKFTEKEGILRSDELFATYFAVSFNQYHGYANKVEIKRVEIDSKTGFATLSNREVERFSDINTVSFKDSYVGNTADALMLRDGVLIHNCGWCRIKDVTCGGLVIPEGVNHVKLKGRNNIKELVLPKSCRVVTGAVQTGNHTEIGELYGEGLYRVYLGNIKITRMHVGPMLRAFYTAGSNTAVGEFKGTLKAYDFPEHITGCYRNLDLSQCNLGYNPILRQLYSQKVIMPSYLKKAQVHLRGIEKIVFGDKLEELQLAGYEDADSIIQFTGTPTKSIQKMLRNYDIDYEVL